MHQLHSWKWAGVRNRIHSYSSLKNYAKSTSRCSFSLNMEATENSREHLLHTQKKKKSLSGINLQEVLTHQEQICSSVNKPLRADDVKLAWEEITHLVNNCCPGPASTVVRCRETVQCHHKESQTIWWGTEGTV